MAGLLLRKPARLAWTKPVIRKVGGQELETLRRCLLSRVGGFPDEPKKRPN